MRKTPGHWRDPVATVLLLLVAPAGALGQAPWPDGPWPMFRGNPQRTGSTGVAGPSHGRVAWRFAAGAPVRSPPAVGADQTVYFGSDAGKLHALGPDGKPRAELVVGGRIWAGPLLAGDRVFFGSDNQRFYAVEWRGGRLAVAWERRSGDFIYGSAAPLAGDVIFGSWDGGLYRLSRADGARRWRYRGRGDFESSPALSRDGQTIYVGSRDRKIHAVSAGGRLRWKARAGDSVNGTPAVGPDGTVYFGSDDGRLYAVDGRGRRRWAFRTEGDVLSSPALDPAARTVYVGSHDGHLYAVDAENGALRWKHACDVVWSSPAVGPNGDVFFGAWDGKVWALSREGAVRWAVQTGAPIWSSPALAPGRLYIGSNDGHLYAIE
jgi:outer membrane protein assembly factor BamB